MFDSGFGRSIEGARAAGVRVAAFVWNVGGLLVAVAVYGVLASPLAASPTLAGHDLGPELEMLEVAVSRSPGDADALETLVDAYLERSAPGLAQAVIHRAPATVRGSARVADLEARSLSALGLAEEALATQERALLACANAMTHPFGVGAPNDNETAAPNNNGTATCSNRMLVHAERRVRWLRELVRLKVDDRLPGSAAAWVAYRLAVREVRLAVP